MFCPLCQLPCFDAIPTRCCGMCAHSRCLATYVHSGRRFCPQCNDVFYFMVSHPFGMVPSFEVGRRVKYQNVLGAMRNARVIVHVGRDVDNFAEPYYVVWDFGLKKAVYYMRSIELHARRGECRCIHCRPELHESYMRARQARSQSEAGRILAFLKRLH
jgi:hypothetical protein